MLKQQKTITSTILGHFNKTGVLLGKLNYKILPNKIVIRIPYFIADLQPEQKGDHFYKLVSAIKSALGMLSNVSPRTLELELRFIQVRYPYLESNILNQYIAINTSKYNFNRIQRMLYSALPNSSSAGKDLPKITTIDRTLLTPNSAPITGIKMELAGRLTTQRSIPRKTVSSAHAGKFNKVAMSQYPSKNKLGSFTIKV